jgi:hypothetical protein
VNAWKTDIEPSPELFSFIPPKDAQILDPNALIELDELLPGEPQGGDS